MIRVVAICDTCAHQHQVSHLEWSTVTCTKCGADIPNTFPDTSRITVSSKEQQE